MDNKNKYWKGLEELNNDPKFVASRKNEFAEGLPLQEILNGDDFDLASNRRDFLKYFGFGLSAVTLAACNTAPIRNAIPYVVKPDVITPGVANWYASTCGACSSGCGILVKTREGRPIKIEGNELSPISKGGVCAFGHGSLLSLYDMGRTTDFLRGDVAIDPLTADKEIKAALEKISAAGKNIRIVSGTINSPSTKKVIADFIAKYPTTKHIVYDAVSNSGMLEANMRSFGKAVIPGYRFDKAKVIVSFDADFLGSWISPVEYIRQYASARKINREKKEMSRHIQFEPRLSVTGSNADVRIPIKPSQEGALLVSLYNNLANKTGGTQIGGGVKSEVALNMISNAAAELAAAKGNSLVVSGSNDVNIQQMVNGINLLLGNYGNTLDLDNYSLQKTGNDAEFETFVSDLNKGNVGAVIFYNVNPVYSYRNGDQIASGIKKATLSISTAAIADETARLVQYSCPDNHYLESWNDSEPKAGVFQLTQPTISPVFKTRQVQESLLRWAGNTQDYYSYLQDNWKNTQYGTQSAHADFVSFWNHSLHDGVFIGTPKTALTPSFGANLNDFASGMTKGGQATDDLEVILYEKVGLKNGSAGNNPWMHELPDPISKVCWDNYASVSKATATKLGLEEGNLVNVSVNGKTINDLPVLIQPGQARNTIAIAVGYGREESDKAPIGKNAFPLVSFANGSTQLYAVKASVDKAVGSYTLAQTQTHHTIEGRALVKEATLEEYIKDASAGNHDHHDLVSLWDERDYKGHHWKMAIDLNACTGCGACVVACQSENNVPVVGRVEVLRSREMHWMRIDRYYGFVDKQGHTISKEREMDDEEKFDQVESYDNVKVVFQPMLCQQCDHAPCESVCPVLATTHSSEGLNQMTYNRCIGTKYCANNCPYKVRRFNWFRYNDNDDFNYHFNNDLGKMVINPDVTVRTRGVMEKCTFCVQRIQDGKLTAKRENRQLKDGDIKVACQQSCPANAIVFGDYNDKESEVYKLFRNERKYHVLEELDVQPNVAYLTKIRNLSMAESPGMWKPENDKPANHPTEHPAEHLDEKTHG